jgi:hypothetical protein
MCCLKPLCVTVDHHYDHDTHQRQRFLGYPSAPGRSVVELRVMLIPPWRYCFCATEYENPRETDHEMLHSCPVGFQGPGGFEDPGEILQENLP